MAAVKRPIRAQRPDPEGRPVDGQLGRFELRDADPTMEYRWANPGGDYDVGYYESGGFEIVRYEEGGAAPIRGGIKRAGEPVTQQGLVLMCRPEAEQLEEWKAGQAEMDRIDQQIHQASYGRHQISKMNLGGFVDVINSSTPARAHS